MRSEHAALRGAGANSTKINREPLERRTRVLLGRTRD